MLEERFRSGDTFCLDCPEGDNLIAFLLASTFVWHLIIEDAAIFFLLFAGNFSTAIEFGGEIVRVRCEGQRIFKLMNYYRRKI